MPRKYHLSLSGTLTMPCPSTWSYSSMPVLILASNSSTGFFVMMLTAPAIALRPNSVACGPLTTSTRSMS